MPLRNNRCGGLLLTLINMPLQELLCEFERKVGANFSSSWVSTQSHVHDTSLVPCAENADKKNRNNFPAPKTLHVLQGTCFFLLIHALWQATWSMRTACLITPPSVLLKKGNSLQKIYNGNATDAMQWNVSCEATRQRTDGLELFGRNRRRIHKVETCSTIQNGTKEEN